MKLKLGFIGAGGVNFGGPEGPWDHATRLEKYCSDNAIVTSIVDPDAERIAWVLKSRRANPKYAHMYHSTVAYKTVAELLQAPQEDLPDAVFIGLPPLCHGSTQSPFDVEIQLGKAGIHMFIEKPLSCHPAEQVQRVNECLASSTAKDGKPLVTSVGYMLRYSSAVKKMQEILHQNDYRVISTVARYNCTYNSILKTSWWDQTFSGGPIVEQATHFCDLSRLFGGEVDLESVRSVCVGACEEIGKLSAMPIDENLIAPENRVPRATSAVWKYKNGAIGSLNHGLLMQGQKYSAEFEVWGDGVRMTLLDPYGDCKLMVRTPDSDFERRVEVTDEDMYLNEVKVFIDAIRSRDTSSVCSNYQDASNTFCLSWAIRDAAIAQAR